MQINSLSRFAGMLLQLYIELDVVEFILIKNGYTTFVVTENDGSYTLYPQQLKLFGIHFTRWMSLHLGIDLS